MLHVNVQRGSGVPLVKQLYDRVRNLILDGGLKAGEKLPSTREMARDLNVSRNTAMEAYESLIAEGYLTGVPGSGIYVAEGVKFPKLPETVEDYRVTAYSSEKLEGGVIGFQSGTPALDLFPRGKWGKVAGRAWGEAPVSALGYDDPQGRPELRNTLAAYLKKARGVRCHPDQILVTSGAKQGLSLAAKCLLRPGDEAWIEDPTNENVRRIFSYHTDRLVPIAVDREGIKTGMFPANGRPALIFVTPSHQFPLGGILSIQRRLELIRYARKAGCFIVEDDYDSEFRYKGMPVGSLQELDQDRVIYIGTFSKILFPSLRLGYLVLPLPLVERFREWKRLGDHHSNSLSQLTLMRFIESGDLERHIARMKKVYRRRRDALIAGLLARFPGKVGIMGEAAGMHVVADFPGTDFTPALMRDLGEAGVNVIPVENHALVKGKNRGRIILGYAHLRPEEIEEGLCRLERILGPRAASRSTVGAGISAVPKDLSG